MSDELFQIRPTRRSFLQWMGASLAMAGCARDLPDKILPYTVRPREVTPGVPNFYATSMVLDGFATGLLVESHEGRPTKIEGNPQHPLSLGATGLWHQASILQLYDPARAGRVRHKGNESGWHTLLMHLHQKKGNLRLLLEPTSSPLVHELLDRLRAARPGTEVTFFAPCSSRTQVEGARLAFGRSLQPRYDLGRADVILSLDSDLLGNAPGSLRYARDWSSRRRLDSPEDELNRLYMVEPALSVTGSVADHRLPRRLGEIQRLTAAVAAEIDRLDARVGGALDNLRVGLSADEEKWAAAVARDLERHRGAALVVAGRRLPAEVHALAYAMNAALGNLGKTLSFSEALIPDGDQDLEALVDELNAGQVETLVIGEGDPCYTATADLDWCAALARAGESVYLGLYENQTARACTWSAPSLHYLESWGDARSVDGTLSLIQPLIRPLHDGRQLETLLSVLAGSAITDPWLLLRDSLEARGVSLPEALPRGFVPGPLPEVTPRLDWSTVAADLSRLPSAGDLRLEVDFALSPVVHDGRFAHNPWLQETPQPNTKLTWDNAALLSADTARRLGVVSEDLVEIQLGTRRARCAVLVTSGHADDCLTLHLGYGQSSGVATAGFDVYPLRTWGSAYVGGGARLQKVGRHRLAVTQEHQSQMGRELALSTTLAAYRRDPQALTARFKEPLPSLLPEVEYQGLQWAMSIDLGLCTGCSACTVACYTENNNQIVGKAEVLHQRQMDWLRIDSYFEGGAVIHQPMMCQHCEKAPCEYVCPVNATVHSPDGLNEMVYNRCVGTRFCSNNCPYKVRRFNWFDWGERIKFNQGLVQLHQNPDVTVRERGVMEKCTYCVQRIREAEISASVEKRDLARFQTACQQACPTRAIEFGSLSWGDSEMARRRRQPRAYAVLYDQGTQPRTLYLARVTNPNPELP
jgi:molybdopterin-containing oxidoreductase family iron-sulfur binding subunit